VIDAGLNVRAFFTSRDGGVSDAPYATLNLATHVGDDAGHVDLNRSVVEHEARASVAYLNAEHGARVFHVRDARATVPAADVLVTNTQGIAIAAIAADCVPLLLHDAASGAVAAAHIGRNGLWVGAVDAAFAALLKLRERPASPALIAASIGPAICGRCYEVPVAMRFEVGERHPSAVATTSWGTPSLDIPKAVETRLGELGVVQIMRQRYCTYEDAMFFSFRREGTTGRQCGVVVCGVSLPSTA
jgi:YfiH family protein